MSNAKIKAIIKRPDEKYGHMTNISNTLENLQRTVDGYIEAVTYMGTVTTQSGSFVVICNEEGRIRNLPFNCWIGGNCFHGTIIVVEAKVDEFTDLTMSMQNWKKLIDANNHS